MLRVRCLLFPNGPMTWRAQYVRDWGTTKGTGHSSEGTQTDILSQAICGSSQEGRNEIIFNTHNGGQ